MNDWRPEDRVRKAISLSIGDGEFAMLDTLLIEARSDDRHGAGEFYASLRERLGEAWRQGAES
jgi:hypothetical protein